MLLLLHSIISSILKSCYVYVINSLCSKIVSMLPFIFLFDLLIHIQEYDLLTFTYLWNFCFLVLISSFIALPSEVIIQMVLIWWSLLTRVCDWICNLSWRIFCTLLNKLCSTQCRCMIFICLLVSSFLNKIYHWVPLMLNGLYSLIKKLYSWFDFFIILF